VPSFITFVSFLFFFLIAVSFFGGGVPGIIPHILLAPSSWLALVYFFCFPFVAQDMDINTYDNSGSHTFEICTFAWEP
jgi:hypothetical protein